MRRRSQRRLTLQRFIAGLSGYHFTVKKPNRTVVGIYDPSRREGGRIHPLGLFELTLVSEDDQVVYVTVPVEIVDAVLVDPITISFDDGTEIVARKI